jgi:adenosylmethionine-8-amino-7-oxononanoate aminotransferase
VAKHACVHGARRCGTIAAFEIEDGSGGYLSALAPRLMAFFRARGVLLRPLGNTVYVMPPYCITEPELAEIWSAIDEAMTRLAAGSL